MNTTIACATVGFNHASARINGFGQLSDNDLLHVDGGLMVLPGPINAVGLAWRLIQWLRR